MNEKYAQITSLFKELDMYESKGLHKLADEILNKIKKVAKRFDPNTDLGYKGMDDFFQNLIYQYACSIPECYEFFCGQSAGDFIMHRDFTDITIKALKNPGTKITDVAKQQQGLSDAVNRIMDLSSDKENKINTCLQKLHAASDKAGGGSSQAGNSAAQIREIPPTM